MTKVTILMSVFNEDASFLEQSITSIGDQNYENLEIVIVDDGSSDIRTIDALERAAAFDPRVRLYREPHRGLTASLNRGLTYCQTDLICRQDSDDWSDPERVNRQVRYMETHPDVAIVGTGVLMHREDGSPLWEAMQPLDDSDIRLRFETGNPFFHGSVCFRRSAMREIGGYREIFKVSQDYDCFWRLSEKFQCANIPDTLYHLRITRSAVSTVSNDAADSQLGACALIQELARQRKELGREMIDAAIDAANLHIRNLGAKSSNTLRRADRLVLAGYPMQAIKIYIGVILKRPFTPVAWAKLIRVLLFPLAPSGIKRVLFSIRT